MEQREDPFVVYEKKTCTKCRDLEKLLEAEGVSYKSVEYHKTPLSKEALANLIAKTGLSPRELLRTSEPIYKELGLHGKELSADEIISLMVEHPDLLQRPIVLRGEKAVLARPTEKVKELF